MSTYSFKYRAGVWIILWKNMYSNTSGADTLYFIDLTHTQREMWKWLFVSVSSNPLTIIPFFLFYFLKCSGFYACASSMNLSYFLDSPLGINALSWLIYSVLCFLCCVGRTSTWGRAMACVCVHLPAIGVYAVWLDALLPLQFPYNTRYRGCSQPYTVYVCFICMCAFFFLHWMCICSISLTSAIASRSSSANFLSSSPLGEQKLTSCFFSEVNGLSMVTPWA